MYGMVSTDHPRPRKEHSSQQQQQQQQQQNSEGRSGRSHKSIYGRLVGFIRQAWTGVKFALDSETDLSESPPRYRPESVKSLCRLTRFSEKEIKRIYRGFKAECPSGVVQEEVFRDIYAQFFPQGANSSHYAHYVFNTLDQGGSGILSFEDFVMGLSVLSRGTLDEKLRFVFNLYDRNRDGFITKEEMRDVVTAVYELMGNCAEPNFEESIVNDRVERIFLKMDQNRDGVVTMDEFLVSCTKDETITRSICVFDSVI